MPAHVARLLKAAQLETKPPEVALGVMFGAIAHLLAAVHEQWPEGWTTFQFAARNGVDELRRVIASDTPAATIADIVAAQKRAGRETLEKAQSRDTQ
jgi:hypothetical protein